MNNKQLYEKIMTNIRKSLVINEMGVMHHRPDANKKLALLRKFFEDLYKMPGYTVSIYRPGVGNRFYTITGNEQQLIYNDIKTVGNDDYVTYNKLSYFYSFEYFMLYVNNIMSAYENRFNNCYFRIDTSSMDKESINCLYKTGLFEYNLSDNILSISFFKLFWNIEQIYDIFYNLHNDKADQFNNKQYNKFIDFFINLCQVPDIMVKFSDNDDIYYIYNNINKISHDNFVQMTLNYKKYDGNDYLQLLQKLFGYVYNYNIHFADDIFNNCKDIKMSIYLLDKEDVDMLCKYGFKQYDTAYGAGVIISLTDLYDNIDEIYDAFYAEDEVLESTQYKRYKNLKEGECCCDCGTVDVGAGMYNNAFNTVGMGDVVPAGMGTIGSGDRFDNYFMDQSKPKKGKKKSKKKIRVYTKR